MTFYLLRLYGVLVLLSSVLVGCANLPKVNYTYYETNWKAIATASQTIGCSADNKILSNKVTPDVAVTYFSDLAKPHTININDLSHWYASSDFKMAFTADGRLKSIDQSTTGEGENIIKGVVSFASAVALMAVQGRTIEERCASIKTHGGDKPITLTYQSEPIGFATDQTKATVKLQPTEGSAALYEILKADKAITEIQVTASMKDVSVAGANMAEKPCSSVALILQKMRPVEFVFMVGDKQIPSEAPIMVPTSQTYELPILKARLFGKQTFTLALTNSGSIDSVSYGMTSGGAGLGNALTAAAGAEAASITARANEVKAKADILSNQHRIVICETKPDECK